ncbi:MULTISPECIES: hypothetical protein [unclassified Janthinobacterium]|uniref:hypothetical protein n=1 Tax=unclassified Janthinobacterium TaxID=2610881 RepID=UPI001621E001|nr:MULTISPECIES: hypothetical protein [unclassified Janthinobacterium]MBB5369211.1 hypothetical protein [Janthinobacterium sp. K2C7]MBB5381252.1 hypothetical protein [Janthinobacterium sp. K2Li3]MBB5387594.1 hypothetical protein [Janthinobacterium sp. K2E3]
MNDTLDSTIIHERREAALSSAMRVEQLADSLSQAATSLHGAVMRAIRKRAGQGENGISQTQAQAVFALEVALRQQANQLYADAAGHTVAGLDAAQRQLSGLLDAVRLSIARNDNVRHWIILATSLLNLGNAVIARNPERILASVDKVRERLQTAPHD